jgi:hypothetical protein
MLVLGIRIYSYQASNQHFGYLEFDLWVSIINTGPLQETADLLETAVFIQLE